MREPSASHLALAQACAHPWTSGLRWPLDGSAAGELGTRIHAAVAALVMGWLAFVYRWLVAGLSRSETETLRGCVEQAREYLAARPATWREVELWTRYHVPTGRVERSARGVRKLPGEWTAVLDYVALEGGVLVVREWKTGRQEHTIAAARNPQLRLQALVAATLFGACRVRAEIVYLDRDSIEVDAAEFDALDLVEIAEDLRALRAALTQGPTPPAPGPHCTQRYCPLRGVCSATQSALAAVQPLEQPLTPTIRDAAHARYVLSRIDGAQAALDMIKHAVAEFARHEVIDLGDGNVYGWRWHETRSVIAETPEQRAAIAGILGPHGTTAVQQKVTWEVSIGALRKAARTKLAAEGKTRGIEKLVDETFAALEKVGGGSTSRYEKPEVFKR